MSQTDYEIIQSVLGLPEVNRKETRQQLMKIFAVYRRWKRQMVNGIPPDVVTIIRKPLLRYEDAADPDMIRAPSPKNSGFNSEDPQERRRRRFVETVEKKVEHLPVAQCVLIKKRFLSLQTPLPNDLAVFDFLYERLLVTSERQYDREKAEALVALADSLGILVFEIPE